MNKRNILEKARDNKKSSSNTVSPTLYFYMFIAVPSITTRVLSKYVVISDTSS